MGLGSTTVQGEFLGSFSIASIEPLLGGRTINCGWYDDRASA